MHREMLCSYPHLFWQGKFAVWQGFLASPAIQGRVRALIIKRKDGKSRPSSRTVSGKCGPSDPRFAIGADNGRFCRKRLLDPDLDAHGPLDQIS